MKAGRMKRTVAAITVLVMAMTCTPAAVHAEGSADGDMTGKLADSQLLKVTDTDGSEASLSEIDEEEYNGFIYALKEDATEEQIEEIESNIEEIGDEEVAEEISSGEVYAAESLDVIEQVADPSAIEYIEPNYLVHIAYTADPGDRYNGSILNTIRIKSVWDAGVLGAGQNGVDAPVIAVMDTGLAGISFKSRRHEDLNYGRFPKALWNHKFKTAEDDNGHGTFLVGEILATMGNNKGVSGLMPKTKIVPVKVLDKNGQGETKDIISAMNRLIKNNDVDVINMSFTAPRHSTSLERACVRAARKGMILVAAAGNYGNSAIMYPAGYKGVIGVAAIKGNGYKWSHSEYNDSVDVAAPGVDMYGLSINSTHSYTVNSGTSMAAPVVSALAAMVKSIDPSVKHDQFAAILKRTSRDKGKTGYDVHYGMGIVDFNKAYQYVNANKGRIKADRIKKSKKKKKEKIKRLKAGTNRVAVKVRKLKKTTSYQIAIKKKGKKYIKMRSSKNKFTILNLKRKSTYYIKVRAVRNLNGVMVFGKWSKLKKFRTK